MMNNTGTTNSNAIVPTTLAVPIGEQQNFNANESPLYSRKVPGDRLLHKGKNAGHFLDERRDCGLSG